MHNPVNTVISFGLMIAVVGGSFYYVYATAPARPWTGITFGGIISADTPEELRRDQNHGFLIVTIAPASPADRAGLRGGSAEGSVVIDGQQIPTGGDIILSIDDRQINQRDDICAVLGQKQVGDSVVFEIAREGNVIDVNVTLGELPPGENTFC